MPRHEDAEMIKISKGLFAQCPICKKIIPSDGHNHLYCDGLINVGTAEPLPSQEEAEKILKERKKNGRRKTNKKNAV